MDRKSVFCVQESLVGFLHFLLYKIQVLNGLHLSLEYQIAQRETFHISFMQFANKGYDADFLTPGFL